MKPFWKLMLIQCMLLLPVLANGEANPVTSDAAPTPTGVTSTAPPVITLPSLPTLLSGSAPADSKPLAVFKVGYVDMQRIANESVQGKGLQSRLQAKRDSLQKKVDVRKKQLEKFQKDTEAKMPGLTPKQREAKSKEFQKKVEEYQKFARGLEEELFTLQEQESKGLVEGTERTARRLAEEQGLSAVLVQKEVLYLATGVETKDITTDLLKIMDAPAEKK